MTVRGMSSEIAVVRQVGVGDSVSAGALAGIAGGALFILVAMIIAAATGDSLSPLRLVGATFVGAGALEGGASIIWYGLLLHLAVSAFWGGLFAVLVPRDISVAATVLAGLIYGFVVMLIMLYLVLPVANPVMREAVDGTSAFTFGHLLYGAALSLVPVFRRRFTSPLH